MSSHYQRRLTVNHDEHVVGTGSWYSTGPASRRCAKQPGPHIAHDWAAFGYYFRYFVVAYVANRRRDTATE